MRVRAAVQAHHGSGPGRPGGESRRDRRRAGCGGRTELRGSPSDRSLGIRIYLDEPATGDVAAITTEALRLAWGFRGFTPVSYTVQVWNGPRQKPPYDNSKRVDLTPVLGQLDLPSSRVFKGDLTASIDDLTAKFVSPRVSPAVI